jgi:polyhydroxyalkanoate synthesis regulator phasin
MLDTVRKYVEAGREALTPKKAEELARALIEQGQARADQAGRIARDLIDWSRKNSEQLLDTIRHEVQKQMSKAGVATKDEVESLKRRIRELESQKKAASPRRATTQRSAGTSGSAGRTSATKRTGIAAKGRASGATRGRGTTTRRTRPPGTRSG